MKNLKKKILIVFLSIIVISAGAFFAYSAIYYRAEQSAQKIITDNPDVVTVTGKYTIFKSNVESDTALVFYPGGKVEHTAYANLCYNLSQNGINVVLVKMPFNLAVFDTSAAEGAFALLPEVKNWYISGHSLGGAMASSYVSKNTDKVKGLVLLGSYVYGDIGNVPALTIYGSNDNVLDKTKVTGENTFVIEGGNHAYFGNYGEQKGDGKTEISREEQQGSASESILNFIINSKEKEVTTMSEYKKISPDEAKQMMDNEKVIVLDVRTQGEFSEGHIENAVLLTDSTVKSKAAEVLPDKNAKILVYCRSGARSASASRELIKLGYTNVYDFGGIMSWEYEVVK